MYADDLVLISRASKQTARNINLCLFIVVSQVKFLTYPNRRSIFPPGSILGLLTEAALFLGSELLPFR